jgi:hypothetical protein
VWRRSSRSRWRRKDSPDYMLDIASPQFHLPFNDVAMRQI